MDPITVRDNLVRAALMMGARQAVLFASGLIFGNALRDGGMIEALASALVFLATLAYGQVRGWIDKRKAVKLAERAPNARVVK